MAEELALDSLAVVDSFSVLDFSVVVDSFLVVVENFLVLVIHVVSFLVVGITVGRLRVGSILVIDPSIEEILLNSEGIKERAI